MATETNTTQNDGKKYKKAAEPVEESRRAGGGKPQSRWRKAAEPVKESRRAGGGKPQSRWRKTNRQLHWLTDMVVLVDMVILMLIAMAVELGMEVMDSMVALEALADIVHIGQQDQIETDQLIQGQ